MPNKLFKKMAKILVLSKESSESEIKRYFNAVLKLSQSDNEFPINLDEVWMLVYPRKDHAVRALKENFMEGIDYKTLPKNGEQDEDNGWGGNNKIAYFLTVPCMEFFIARKVRPVFEVYRKVFHHVANNAVQLSLTPTRVRASLEWVRGVSDLLNLNDSSKLTLITKVAQPLGLPVPDYTPSHGILKSATELLKENGIHISVQDFNKRLMEHGYIVTLMRKSSGGKEKPFKSITEKGLPYGENQVNPNNPKSTQPLWYADKFMELAELVGINVMVEA